MVLEQMPSGAGKRLSEGGRRSSGAGMWLGDAGIRSNGVGIMVKSDRNTGSTKQV